MLLFHKMPGLKILIFTAIIGLSLPGCNIIYNKRHGNTMRIQEQKKQRQEAALNNEYRKQQAHQYKMQTQETRKRMAASKKQASKLNRQMRKSSGKKGCRTSR